ncbi:MAG: amylo-alpha-1,6-glucosidase [Telluria sp.]
MKRCAFAVAAAACLPLRAAEVPGVDAFFDQMAIAVPGGQVSRYVAGDNLAGYFEGFTHSEGKGEGYVFKSGTIWRDDTSFCGPAPNDRAAAREEVLPYGHRLRFANGCTEELAVLSKQQALAITLTRPDAGTLALRPLLATSGKVATLGDAIVVAPGAGATLYMALAADQPVSLDPVLTVLSSNPVRKLTVVAAFAATAEEAADRARALAHGDPIGTERRKLHGVLTRSWLQTSDAQYNKALNWAKAASHLFVVEEYGSGIWAGLPWFRDNWGRDTFIALPGTLLVSGQFGEAKAVLSNFARYQNLSDPRDRNYGRIPNRVTPGEIIYNTVDGTPWMLREAMEYVRYTGDREFAAQMYKLAVPYFDGAIANYVDSDGLLRHDSADTWMDARIENKQPWSARGPRAVEIQALWYTALQSGAWFARQAGDEAHARAWSALAQRAQASFLKLFWDGRVMADRLREDGSRDTKVRPNQLMLDTIPFDDFVPREVQAAVLKNAVSQLLYPYGIASLSQDDPYFHPRHENPAFHHKDAAYHQGTVWGWNAGFTVTALDKFGYQDLAWKLSQNLGDQILHLGTLGNMSELLDALPHEGGALKPSGTFAQSWSVAEYARNGYQDYVGFHPDLVGGVLSFAPAIPHAWTSFEARLPFGHDEALDVDYARAGGKERWTFRLKSPSPRDVRIAFLNKDTSRSQVRFRLSPGRTSTLVIDAGQASIDGHAVAAERVQASYTAQIGSLRFLTPKTYRPEDFPMLRAKDVLKGIIERNEYQ